MIKKILKIIGIVIGALLIAVCGLLAWLSAGEYKPAAVELLDVTGGNVSPETYSGDNTPGSDSENTDPEADAGSIKSGSVDNSSESGSGDAAETDIEGASTDDLHVGDTLRIISWNIGYGALGENADFFMDGGENVMTADKEKVEENISAVIGHLAGQDPDMILLQEVDQNSKRSHRVNEAEMIRAALNSSSDGVSNNAASSYQSTFANNFKVPYVPYPVPAIGKVDSGLLTLSRAGISESQRVSLPCPFSWPIRTANLKRCLMTDRIPVASADEGSSENSGAKSSKTNGSNTEESEGNKGSATSSKESAKAPSISSQKDLVLINLHLEAYDSGQGKIEQTKALLKVLDEEREKGNYVIAGGDFNQTFSNIDASAYPVLEDRWHPGKIEAEEFSENNWSLIMDPSTPTCRSLDSPYDGLSDAEKDPSAFQYYMIDGFIISDNLKVKTIETQDLGFVNSDHNPVLLEVSLR